SDIGTRYQRSATCTAGDSALTSVTITSPRRPSSRSARWNAWTSGTRLDAAVTRTLSDFTFAPACDIGREKRRAGIDGADQPAPHQAVERLRLEARRRSKRDDVCRCDDVARSQASYRMQGAPARRDVDCLRRQALLAAVTERGANARRRANQV